MELSSLLCGVFGLSYVVVLQQQNLNPLQHSTAQHSMHKVLSH
jgi:hypothetical protein